MDGSSFYRLIRSALSAGLRRQAKDSRQLDESPASFQHAGAQEQELWLWWPADWLAPESRRSIRWLKHPGQQFEQLEPIAALDGDDTVAVLTPPGLRGRLVRHLAADGSAVRSCQPLAKMIASETGALEPAATYVARPGSSAPLIARLMTRGRISTLAVIGAVSLACIATTLVALCAFVILGGLVPPILAALSMSIVTGALRFAEHVAQEPDRDPS